MAVPKGVPAVDGLAALEADDDFELISQACAYADVVGLAARELEPHRVVFYLQDLAASLHRFYNKNRILGDEAPGACKRVSPCSGWCSAFSPPGSDCSA